MQHLVDHQSDPHHNMNQQRADSDEDREAAIFAAMAAALTGHPPIAPRAPKGVRCVRYEQADTDD